jgi:hypothetical protein
MVGLHYIDFSKPAIAGTRLISLPTSKFAELSGWVTKFGYRVRKSLEEEELMAK